MAKRKTNIGLVKELMEFSQYGALSQVFIVQAIRDYADNVAKANSSALDTPMISGDAWKGVAIEIKTKMDEFYK